MTYEPHFPRLPDASGQREIWGQFILVLHGTVDGIRREVVLKYEAKDEEALKRALLVALVGRLPEPALGEAITSLSEVLEYYDYRHAYVPQSDLPLARRAQALAETTRPDLIIAE